MPGKVWSISMNEREPVEVDGEKVPGV